MGRGGIGRWGGVMGVLVALRDDGGDGGAIGENGAMVGKWWWWWLGVVGGGGRWGWGWSEAAFF